MPVQKLENNIFRIRHLRLETGTSGRRTLYFTGGPSIDVYVLCFTSGMPIKVEELQKQLDENDLEHLMNYETLQKENFWLQGVPRRLITNGSFSNFKVEPPATIQVWAMTRAEYGKAVLYVPAEGQVCFAPILYHVDVQRQDKTVVLEISITDANLYPDGALFYQVNAEKRIPIPKEYINCPIQFRVAPGDEIKVLPDEQYRGQYQKV